MRCALVTGVQTCARPISPWFPDSRTWSWWDSPRRVGCLTMSRNAHTSLPLCWTGDERCQGDDRGPFVVRSCGTVKRRFCGAGRKATAMLDFLSRPTPRGLVARSLEVPAALTVFLVLHGPLGPRQAQPP